MMLDLLEDYIVEQGYPFERIDGDIMGANRQVESAHCFFDSYERRLLFILSTLVSDVSTGDLSTFFVSLSPCLSALD
jgi:hypothetical protein